jgi:hypothetical protein
MSSSSLIGSEMTLIRNRGTTGSGGDPPHPAAFGVDGHDAACLCFCGLSTGAAASCDASLAAVGRIRGSRLSMLPTAWLSVAPHVLGSGAHSPLRIFITNVGSD